ncbi:hypothetical protein ABH923_002334 [Leifsonia sp. EB41]
MPGVGASRPRHRPGAFSLTEHDPWRTARIAVHGRVSSSSDLHPRRLRGNRRDRATRRHNCAQTCVGDQVGQLNPITLVRCPRDRVVHETLSIDANSPSAAEDPSGEEPACLADDPPDRIMLAVIMDEHHRLILVMGRALEPLQQRRPRELEARRTAQAVLLLVDDDCESSCFNLREHVEMRSIDKRTLGGCQGKRSKRTAGPDQIVRLDFSPHRNGESDRREVVAGNRPARRSPTTTWRHPRVHSPAHSGRWPLLEPRHPCFPIRRCTQGASTQVPARGVHPSGAAPI